MSVYEFKKEKLVLIKQAPALGFISLMLKPEEDPKMQTIGVDNQLGLYYNSKWIMNQTFKNRVGILAHESAHVLLEHVYERRGYAAVFRKHKVEYNHLLTNIAQDMCINIILQQFNFSLPEGRIVPEDKYRGLAVESILDKMIKDNKLFSKNMKTTDDHSKFGSKKDGNNKDGKDKVPSCKESKGTKEGISDDVKKEIIKQKVKSMLSASTDGISEAFKPLIKKSNKVPWRSILKDCITSVKSQTRMTYPNRHLAGIQSKVYHNKIIYGKIKKINVPKVCFFVDISGSIGKKTITSFMGVVKSIESAVRTCDIITFNHQLCDHLTLKDLKQEISIQSSGGTNYRPIKNYTEQNKYDLNILLTDGYFADKVEKIPRSVAFLTDDNEDFTNKFGKTITIGDD